LVAATAVIVIARDATVKVVADDDASLKLVLAAFVAVTVHVVPTPPVVDRVAPTSEHPAVPGLVTEYETAPSPEPPLEPRTVDVP
jgi:hypothetical protein